MKPKNRSKSAYITKMLIMAVLLVLSVPLCVLWGSADISYGEVVRVILSKLLPFYDYEPAKWIVSVVWELRFPRVLLGCAVGGGLAVCGVVMQSVTRNILAEPYILGVSSGASAMAVFVLMFGGSSFLTRLGVSGAAFLGALLSLFLVYGISIANGKSTSNRLLLAGVAVSAILNAVTQFIILVAPDANNIKSALYWMMGSLASARWSNVILPIIASILGLLLFRLLAKSMDLLSQGDETAITLGVNATQIRKILLVLVSLVTGVLVSASGCIGFVGLIVPHVVRMFVGADNRRVIPTSFLLGAIFLVWVDVLARVLLAPSEISIGILTAFCGGPFFIWLLRKKMKG